MDQLVCEGFSSELAGQKDQTPKRLPKRSLRGHDDAKVMPALPEVFIGQRLKVSDVEGHQRSLLGDSARKLLRGRLQTQGAKSLRAERSNLCLQKRLLRRLWLLAMTLPIRFSNRRSNALQSLVFRPFL